MSSFDPRVLDGKWSLESRENLDAFMAARGASWLFRKMALGLKADFEFKYEEETG